MFTGKDHPMSGILRHEHKKVINYKESAMMRSTVTSRTPDKKECNIEWRGGERASWRRWAQS